MSVLPKVILGDPISGLGGDNILQAFGKYNEHEHHLATATNPLLLGINTGDVIQSVSDCETPAFPANTTVVSVSPTQIVASADALRTTICTLQIGTQFAFQAVVTADSANISLTRMDGFASGKRVEAQASKVLSGLLTAQNSTYPLLLQTPWSGVLSRLVLKTLSGTCTAALRLNGVSKSAVAVTSTAQTVDFSNTIANGTVFTADTDIDLLITAVANSPLLHYSLYLYALDS